MKAIVMYAGVGIPQYLVDFPEPIVSGDNEILISMKAVAIKHLDKSRISGKHYSSKGDLHQAKVPGGDGVGLLSDGTRVYAIGTGGMMAEKAIVESGRVIRIPKGVDDATAAALPNAVAGSAMALRFRAGIKAGETVLINGATGFTGKIAVQIAKYYGAGKIIVTGRNERTLRDLLDLGADEVIHLSSNLDGLTTQLKKIHGDTPIDIILDYLWGHTAEAILAALKGGGSFSHKTRFVSIGSMAGDKIQFSSEIIRSADLQILGSGLGSWTAEEMRMLITEIVPEMFQLAADHKLKVDTEKVALKDIPGLWDADVPGGKRLVVTI